MRDGRSHRCKNEYYTDAEYAYLTIIRKNGERITTVFDIALFETIRKYHWQYTNVGYIRTTSRQGTVMMHRMICELNGSKRVIPMLQKVKDALLLEYEIQSRDGFNETVIDGYSGFIFKNRFGAVVSALCINKAIERICRDYNKEEKERAQAEQREPVLIPRFTAHQLRHTFCTRFCENETNIKVIQEIMGHADISTTMDIYNEATMAKKFESFANLEDKIRIC